VRFRASHGLFSTRCTGTHAILCLAREVLSLVPWSRGPWAGEHSEVISSLLSSILRSQDECCLVVFAALTRGRSIISKAETFEIEIVWLRHSIIHPGEVGGIHWHSPHGVANTFCTPILLHKLSTSSRIKLLIHVCRGISEGPTKAQQLLTSGTNINGNFHLATACARALHCFQLLSHEDVFFVLPRGGCHNHCIRAVSRQNAGIWVLTT